MSAWSKIWTNIGWQNKPSRLTPLGESNLSKLDDFNDEIDDRVVSLKTDKADNSYATITPSQTRTNLADGDDMPTILGKIKKYFSDLGDLAFLNKDGNSSKKYLRGDGTWQSFNYADNALVLDDGIKFFSDSTRSLNYVLRPGTYACTTSAWSNQINDQPIAKGSTFTLVVQCWSDTLDAVRQIYWATNSNDTYVRYCTDGVGSIWSSWENFVFSGSYNDLTDKPTSMPASDVYAWAKASTKPTYTASEVGAIATTAKGAANGVAELDANGKIPASQIPGSVDSIVEGYLYNGVFYRDAEHTQAITPSDNKIYVDLPTNLTYRWSGSAYIEISQSLALGETSSTAYRGDRGKIAYDHATESGKISSVTASGLYKIAATAEGHIASLTAAVKADFTALGLADASLCLPLAGGEMTGRIDTYAPPSDIMPAIMPKTAFCGSVGFSNKPYRFGFFQGAVLGASYEEAGTSKMGTLSMYTGLGAYAAVIKPDQSQSASEVDLVLPKTSGTLALTSEIPTKTSDLTNDSGFVTTDEKVTAEIVDPYTETVYRGLYVPNASMSTNQKPNTIGGTRVYLKNGSASALGYVSICIGNDTASGTAGNKYGELWMYSEKSGYVKLRTNANSTTARTIWFPDKDGTIALTKDLTTYAFAEGTNNGEIKITPSVGGTAQTAVTVKPKGISDLAYIAKGSGSSKFLREDGTWQTVTASWSGGTVTSSIYPNSDTSSVALGLANRRFAYIYGHQVNTTKLYVGVDNSEDALITLYQSSSGWHTKIAPPTTALTGMVNLTTPSESGTLVTDIAYGTGSVDASRTGWALYRFGKMRVLNLTGFTNSASPISNFIPVVDRPTRLVQVEGMGWSYTNKQAVSIIVLSDGRLGFAAMNGNAIVPNSVRGTVVWSVD